MTDPKCDACNQVETLTPCGFCNQPVVIRYNTMTGVHYISHEDWNSRCPQRPFYGSAEQWNVRVREDALRAENERLPARTGKAAHRPYITDEREWADFQAWRAARKQEGGR